MPQPSPSNRQSSMSLSAVAIALVTCVLFGGNQVASKIALQQFPPLLTAALAFTISSISLWMYAGCEGNKKRFPSAQIWRLHLLSAILFVLFNATALIGLQFTLASRASIFIAMHPLFVVLFNYLTPSREQIGWRRWVGLGLTFLGIFIVFSDRLAPRSGASWFGDGLILLASAVLGMLILHIRTVTHYVSSLQATLWRMSLSVPLFWLATLMFESPLIFSPLSHSWWGIIYMGLAVNALAFVLRAELFSRYSANTISVFLSISPLTGLWLSYWLLGEPLTRTVILGGAMIAIGVFLVYRCENLH